MYIAPAEPRGRAGHRPSSSVRVQLAALTQSFTRPRVAIWGRALAHCRVRVVGRGPVAAAAHRMRYLAAPPRHGAPHHAPRDVHSGRFDLRCPPYRGRRHRTDFRRPPGKGEEKVAVVAARRKPEGGGGHVWDARVLGGRCQRLFVRLYFIQHYANA